MRCFSIFIVAVILLALSAPFASAQTTITVTNDQPVIEFPDRLTFKTNFKSDIPIEKVVLEYGVDRLTCGQVVAKAFPDIQPGKDVDAEWTWEMKQSGSLPPGSRVRWRWRVTDKQGLETVTNQKMITWLDAQHDWQTITGGDINLHWYGSDQSFGRELHDSAVKSLADLAQVTGVRANNPIDLYIYASVQDMRDAILYEPGWTGGLAYADQNIVIIGIAPDQIGWGKRTQAHELTHVLVGQLTFSCLSDIPTWLQEGLAVYGEGGPEPGSLQQLQQSISDNTLLPVRSLSGNFSEDPGKADLSYSQSYSLVKFLIEKYGQAKMLQLLRTLRDGATVDQALQLSYGFDIDGFEDAWRASISASPRPNSGSKPTSTPVPTIVPTFALLSAAPIGPTLVPTRERPTPSPIALAQSEPALPLSAAPTEATDTLSGIPALLIVISAALLAVVIIVVLVVGRRRRRTNI